MKYSLLLFFIFSFFISNAQLGKNRIKLGAQVIRTPYLLKPGFGYQGEYEFIFGNRYAVAFRISQAVGKEKTDDLVMNIPNKEGVNSLEISILSRIFNKSDRNHFKIGSGFSFQSIWVKYSKVVGFNFSVLEYENKKEITNIVMANFCIQNDFYFRE